MVNVPRKGLVVYGSLNYAFHNSQKLTTLDASWTTGPTMYQSQVDHGQCIVQVFLYTLDIFLFVYYRWVVAEAVC